MGHTVSSESASGSASARFIAISHGQKQRQKQRHTFVPHDHDHPTTPPPSPLRRHHLPTTAPPHHTITPSYHHTHASTRLLRRAHVCPNLGTSKFCIKQTLSLPKDNAAVMHATHLHAEGTSAVPTTAPNQIALLALAGQRGGRQRDPATLCVSSCLVRLEQPEASMICMASFTLGSGWCQVPVAWRGRRCRVPSTGCSAGQAMPQ